MSPENCVPGAPCPDAGNFTEDSLVSLAIAYFFVCNPGKGVSPESCDFLSLLDVLLVNILIFVSYFLAYEILRIPLAPSSPFSQRKECFNL